MRFLKFGSGSKKQPLATEILDDEMVFDPGKAEKLYARFQEISNQPVKSVNCLALINNLGGTEVKDLTAMGYTLRNAETELFRYYDVEPFELSYKLILALDVSDFEKVKIFTCLFNEHASIGIGGPALKYTYVNEETLRRTFENIIESVIEEWDVVYSERTFELFCRAFADGYCCRIAEQLIERDSR